MSAYCAAKAGVAMLTQVAAMELGHRGIRVNTIAPGLVQTNATGAFFMVPGVVEEFVENTTSAASRSRATSPTWQRSWPARSRRSSAASLFPSTAGPPPSATPTFPARSHDWRIPRVHDVHRHGTTPHPGVLAALRGERHLEPGGRPVLRGAAAAVRAPHPERDAHLRHGRGVAAAVVAVRACPSASIIDRVRSSQACWWSLIRAELRIVVVGAFALAAAL
jgi:hypothetical protein